MTNFNPAAVFYFTTCLRLEDQETELFHAILESLTRPGNKEDEQGFALSNLARCDTPFQVYAIPFVLQKIQVASRPARQSLDLYFQKLGELFTNQELAEDLFSAILHHSSAEELVQLLLQTGESINLAGSGAEQQENDLPYIDIVEFGEEAIWLAILVHCCQRQEVAAKVLEKMSDNSWMTHLLEQATSHNRGRLCFILAQQLKAQLNPFDQKTMLVSSFWNQKKVSASPALEPDLVYLFQYLWFVACEKNADGDQNLKKITDELGSLQLFSRRMVHRLPSGRNRELYIHQDFEQYLKCIYGKNKLPDTAPEEKDALAVHTWLGSLFLLVSKEFPPEKARNALLPFWQPLTVFENGISLDTPFRLINENITPILNAKTGRYNSRLRYYPQNHKVISPWLPFNYKENIYAEGDKFSHILYTLCAAEAAKTILIQTEGENNQLLASFLVQAADLLNYARPVLEKAQKGLGHPMRERMFICFQQRPNLRKLLLQLNRDLQKLITSGQVQALSYAGMRYLLKQERKENDRFAYFRDNILPLTLFNWFYYSIPNARAKELSDQGRFMLTELEAELPFEQKNGKAAITKIRVLKKYLLGQDTTETGGEENGHESILLKNPRSVAGLEPFSMDDWKSNNHLLRQGCLSRAIQRYRLAGAMEPEEWEKCAGQLKNILFDVKAGSDISYLNRIALICLFGDLEEINEGNKEICLLVTDLIFLTGNAFDIDLLCHQWLEKLLTGKPAPFSAAALEVINNLSAAVAIQLQLTHQAIRANARPCDPLKNLDQEKNLTRLKSILHQMYWIQLRQRQVAAANISIPEISLENPAQWTRETRMDVSMENNIPVYNLSREALTDFANLPVMLIHNSVEQCGILHTQNLSNLDGVLNFFQMNEEEKEKVLNDKIYGDKFTRLALIIRKQVINDKIKYTFKYGCDQKETENRRFQDNTLQPGQLLITRHKYYRPDKDDETEQGYWSLTGWDPFPIQAALSEKQSFFFRNYYAACEHNFSDWDTWLPCHSDIFTGYLQHQFSNGPVRCQVVKNKPVAGYFHQLIAAQEKAGQPLALVFIGMDWDAGLQQEACLFYARFGEYYKIFEDEIAAEGYSSFAGMLWEMPEAEEEGIESLNGLIVCFELTSAGDKIQLVPLQEGKVKDEALQERFPQLHSPFDDRNLRWKKLFDQEEDQEFTAISINNKWYYETGETWRQLNFPAKLELAPDQNIRARELEFTLDDQWKGKGQRFLTAPIRVKVEERVAVNLSQLKAWLNLKPQDPVEVKYIGKLNPATATVSGYSQSNYRITLNLEELTLLPTPTEGADFKFYIRNRRFQVSHGSKWKESKTKLLADHIDEFPDHFINNGEITGYLTDIPRRTDEQRDSDYCTLILVNEHEGIPVNFSKEVRVRLRITDRESRSALRLYTQVRGKRKNGNWQFTLFTRSIPLKASWKLEALPKDPEENLKYIGRVEYGPGAGYLFEQQGQPGILYHWPHEVSDRCQNQVFKNAVKTHTGWQQKKLNPKSPRVSLLNEDQDELLSGSIPAQENRLEGASAFLRGISIRIAPATGGDFLVSRFFSLSFTSPQAEKQNERKSGPGENANAKKQAAFDEYFKNPYSLQGKLNKESGEITISSNNDLKWIPGQDGAWVNKVKLPVTDEIPLEALVFVPSALSVYAVDEVNFHLLPPAENDNRCLADFKTGAEPFEEFMQRLESSQTKGSDNLIRLSRKLYFADVETTHPATGEIHEEEMYRFESGFGQNLLAPRRRIRFMGNPIDTSSLILNHGDAITTVELVTEKNDAEEIKLLNIIVIEFSEAKRLYYQARNHNIYHLANIGKNNRGIYIRYVIGAEETAISESRMTARFKRIYAVFDKRSHDLVLARHFGEAQSDTEKFVLVKVDTGHFEKTGRLRFLYYKFSFIAHEGDEGMRLLSEGARVIMQLGEIGITYSGNDYYAEVSPFPQLDEKDIGKDFTGGRILRRAFSKNEALLRNYFRRHQRDFFNQFEVIVTVNSNKSQEKVFLSMEKNPAFRDNRILIRQNNYRAVVIACNNYPNPEDTLVLEIKPGNFIRVEASLLRLAEKKKIKEGDVLTVTSNGESLQIESAFAGDTQFLQQDRKVVVLPKDSLFNPNNHDQHPFTLGELANIDLGFMSVRPYQVHQFLSFHHPKIASIGLADGGEEAYLKIENDEVLHGFLDIRDNKVRFLNYSPNRTDGPSIKAANLGFLDASLAEILERIAGCQWRYHDKMSRDLESTRDGLQPGEPYQLLPSKPVEGPNNISGPVFCLKDTRQISLRYQDNLLRWAYPVASLTDFLDYRGGEYLFAYAGYDSRYKMHFVEMAPGRITELPVNLLCLVSGGEEIPLHNYAWNLLVPGDTITLKKINDNKLDVFRFAVTAIEHGIRNALSEVSYLPVLNVDTDKGCINAGAGELKISLPFNYNFQPEDLQYPLYLNSQLNQYAIAVKPFTLLPENTVLLGLNEKGYFHFHQFPDNLRLSSVGGEASNRFLATLVEAAGGAIPVQVFPPEGRLDYIFRSPKFFFNRNWLAGKWLCGQVIGSLDDSDEFAVIRMGGYFETIPFNNLISGVPPLQKGAVLEKLRGLRVWLKAEEDEGKNLFLTAGILPEKQDELFVKAIAPVTIRTKNNDNQLIGIICMGIHSMKPYWLPKKEAAWMAMENEAEAWEYIFYPAGEGPWQTTKQPVRVKLFNSDYGPCISRIKTNLAAAAFRNKRCGSDNIMVKVATKPVTNAQGLLEFTGYSLMDKMLLRCVEFSQDKKPKPGDIINTEVIEKDLLNQRIKCMSGEKKIPVYLPLPGLQENAENPASVNLKAEAFYGMGDRELSASLPEIMKTTSELIRISQKGLADLCAGLQLLAVLKKLYLMRDDYHTERQIEKNLEDLHIFLQLNLLKNLYVESLARNQLNQTLDSYLDHLLYEAIKPFISEPEQLISETGFLELRKIASRLCLQTNGVRYSEIGQAILQALGFDAGLNRKAWENMELPRLYKELLLLHWLSDPPHLEAYFETIDQMIRRLKVNRMQIPLVPGKIGTLPEE